MQPARMAPARQRLCTCSAGALCVLQLDANFAVARSLRHVLPRLAASRFHKSAHRSCLTASLTCSANCDKHQKKKKNEVDSLKTLRTTSPRKRIYSKAYLHRQHGMQGLLALCTAEACDREATFLGAISSDSHVNRNPAHKWYNGAYIAHAGRFLSYPPYAFGGGYIVSLDIAQVRSRSNELSCMSDLAPVCCRQLGLGCIASNNTCVQHADVPDAACCWRRLLAVPGHGASALAHCAGQVCALLAIGWQVTAACARHHHPQLHHDASRHASTPWQYAVPLREQSGSSWLHHHTCAASHRQRGHTCPDIRRPAGSHTSSTLGVQALTELQRTAGLVFTNIEDATFGAWLAGTGARRRFRARRHRP